MYLAVATFLLLTLVGGLGRILQGTRVAEPCTPATRSVRHAWSISPADRNMAAFAHACVRA